ncbi:hypothetical protein EV643_102646 [Kribbella sp. VKM Ac-2527]|uniref:Uncharacterized protein n=1 Tax=Kribbella caucasensis TaxID=2512215 RepID=A0A4R6KMI3_9ACTN|nr:hypothetical protein EV643_102646 [Kribbella sp. VKM Ac-2527]
MTPPPTATTTRPTTRPPAHEHAPRQLALPRPNPWPLAHERAPRQRALLLLAPRYVPVSASELLGARKRGGR